MFRSCIAPPFSRFARSTSLWLCRSTLLVCFSLLGASIACAGQSSGQKAQVDWHALGSTPCAWSPAVTDSHGVIDSAATIRILKANGLECYGALIWVPRKGGPPMFDWNSFKKFVAAAQPAGIIVWAVLIPPVEGGNSPPFNRDYVRWMKELARLSLKYPCLKGVNIDDFYWDTKFFTPQYTCSLYSAKQSINPRLQFAPTIYGSMQISPRVMERVLMASGSGGGTSKVMSAWMSG